MIKAKLILLIVKIIMGATALGIGIWYLSSSISGAALTYTSMDSFMSAIGVTNGDITGVNGCFLCGPIGELFAVIGRATELFWTAMLDHIWILMAVGFGIFLVWYTGKYLWDAMTKTADLKADDKTMKLEPWFDRVWRQGVRVIIAGALMGMLGAGGTGALRTVADITIRPAMTVGAALSMAATNTISAAECPMVANTDDVLNPILQPFMCVIGNLNTVTLAGAAGGFSMMNYAWLGLGAGVMTWVAGLALVIMFLIIGFDLFFQILSVIFKLVFVVIFLPLILGAYAFEPVWSAAAGLFKKSIGMVVSSAVRIVAITLKIVILYATISYAADAYFPGPRDGYSAILPPLMSDAPAVADAKSMAVFNVFKTCEGVARDAAGEISRDAFAQCFTAQRAMVERTYPGAFDFLSDGWDFLMLMIGLFALYYFVLSPKIDALLPAGTVKLPIPGENANLNSKEEFDFGAWTYDLGKKIWDLPKQIATRAVKDKD